LKTAYTFKKQLYQHLLKQCS